MLGRGVRARRRRRAVVAAVGVTAVLVAGGGALAVAGEVRPPVRGGAAAAYLPADGSADWVRTQPGGTLKERQNATPVGSSVIFTFPADALAVAWGGYPASERDSIQHWTVSWGGADDADAGSAAGADAGGSAHPVDLYSVLDDGIRLVMTTGVEGGLAMSPGILVLAADARAGATWESSGTAVSSFAPAGSTTRTPVYYDYAAELAASAPADADLVPFAAKRSGCLQVDATLTYRLTGIADATPIDVVDATLWCRGDGIVASATSVNGGARSVTGPHAAPAAPALSATAPGSEWSSPAGWRLAPAPITSDDPTFGPTPRIIGPGVQPVATAVGLAVPDINTQSVSLLTAGDDGLTETRIVRPGGGITALGTAGDLLLAATTERRVVAFAPDGRRLWAADLPDVAAASPLADGDGGILVACVDGVLRDLDAADGAERWAVSVSGDALQSVVVAGGAAVVSDRAGTLTGVSVKGGEVSWSTGGTGVRALATAHGAVFVARDDDLVSGVDAATGAVRWVTPLDAAVDRLVVAGDRLVALTWDDVTGFDAASGSVAWHAAPADDLAGDGVHAVVEGRGAVRLLGEDGADAARWALAAEGQGAARYLVAGGDAVWVGDTVSGWTRVGP